MAFKIDLLKKGTGGQVVFHDQSEKPILIRVPEFSKDLPPQTPIPVNTPPDKKDN